MIRRKKQIKKYLSPSAQVTQMALESNFCQTVRFNMQVDELHNMNLEVDADKRDSVEDPFYFEF